MQHLIAFTTSVCHQSMSSSVLFSIEPVAEDQDLEAVVTLVSEKFASQLDKVRRQKLKPGCASIPKGKVPDQAKECCVCGQKKHSVPWEHSGEKRPAGAWCYSCRRATVLLKTRTRSFQVLKSFDLLDAVRMVSESHRAQALDKVCGCSECKKLA